jgi:hypothetical protein
VIAVLLVIYRGGRTRAMAVGFLVFCVGYLAYLTVLTGTLNSGLAFSSTSVGAAWAVFFDRVHSPHEIGRSIGTDQAVLVSHSGHHSSHFITICNNALACLLGVVGAIAAQVLHATRPNDVGRDRTASEGSTSSSS